MTQFHPSNSPRTPPIHWSMNIRGNDERPENLPGEGFQHRTPRKPAQPAGQAAIQLYPGTERPAR